MKESSNNDSPKHKISYKEHKISEERKVEGPVQIGDLV